MAVAVEALPAAAEGVEGAEAGATARAAAPPGAGFRAISQASGQVPGAARAAYGALPSSGQQRGTQVITRLIWAIALGLVALEIAAQATGQTWGWSLRGLGRQPPATVPYQPLYAGMQADPLVGLHGVPSFRAPSASGPGPLTGP